MRKVLATAAVAALLGTGAAIADDNKGSVEIGTLTCYQTDRTNLVIWSEAKYTCTFEAEAGSEVYTGEIDKIGVDLTIDKVETMSWTVVAPSVNVAPGSLEGNYVGASADASVGVGVGARALIGGGDQSFALQPLALSGEEGLGVAAGIESFKLELAN